MKEMIYVEKNGAKHITTSKKVAKLFEKVGYVKEEPKTKKKAKKTETVEPKEVV